MVRVFAEGPWTCPYWIAGPEGAAMRMRTIVYGCGGYGEVAPHHPAAGEEICGGPARVCKRCKGTGLVRGGLLSG